MPYSASAKLGGHWLATPAAAPTRVGLFLCRTPLVPPAFKRKTGMLSPEMSTPADAPTEPGGDAWLDGDQGIALGARMGRYELVSVLGAGGMGVVFEARDPDLDRTIAVKVLRAKGPGTEGELRLRREGMTMGRLTHPNVIRVYDVGVAHKHVFVAMEYVAGGTLSDWLAVPEPRAPAAILGVFVQAARGL